MGGRKPIHIEGLPGGGDSAVKTARVVTRFAAEPMIMVCRCVAGALVLKVAVGLPDPRTRGGRSAAPDQKRDDAAHGEFLHP
jgi:hypothetical protein